MAIHNFQELLFIYVCTFIYRSSHMTDMICMLQMSPNRLIMGGLQTEIIDFDIPTLQQTQLVSFFVFFFTILIFQGNDIFKSFIKYCLFLGVCWNEWMHNTS